uniref:Lipase_3 domain-containing protein n=2 Tax=Bursaphelenchus xylophilus TaxID=6326 RepID=A0A1I7S1T1_BURXY
MLTKVVLDLTVLANAVSCQFNETFASQKSIFIAIAADSPFLLDKCVERAFDDGKTTLRATAECGPSPIEAKVCFGFVGYSPKQKVIYLGYRGSVSVIQLTYEAYRTVFEEQHDAKIGGKISAYFSTAFNNLRSAGINAEVVRLAQKYPDYEVWVSGHSLGAALGSMNLLWSMESRRQR